MYILYTGKDKPTIRLLMKYNTEMAPQWSYLGIQLLEAKDSKLDVIQRDHSGDIERCCTEMLKFWLNVDLNASWDKLIIALKQIKLNKLAENIEKDIFKGM